MKEVERVAISGEDYENMERLHFEVNALKDTITFMLDAHADDEEYMKKNHFKAYEEKLANKYKEYSFATDKISLEYIPEKYKNSEYQWIADFATSELVIYKVVK